MFTSFTCQSTVCICRTPAGQFLGEDVVQGRACVASISVRLWSKELGTRVKDSAKNDVSKRVGRRGWGRKEGKACRQTLEFWNRPLFMPECAHCHLMLSSAVINWPIKFLVFCGGEMNFWGHLWNQNKVSLYFKSNVWTAVKSQWIWTIKAGFKVKFIFLIRLKGRTTWVKFWLKTSRKLDI